MNFSNDGNRSSAEATLAVVAIGWVADTEALTLAAAGVELNQRKYVKVDEYLQTTAPNIFAAGDVTGRLMLVPEAIHDGFIAATNAVRGPTVPLENRISPVGGFVNGARNFACSNVRAAPGLERRVNLIANGQALNIGGSNDRRRAK
jgi:pyruvate/2-oxoglutarate dehydrogenase complex dihydrolipoamide dehydrogenase (E3) component